MMVNPISQKTKKNKEPEKEGREEETNFPDMKDLTWNLYHLHKFYVLRRLPQTFFFVRLSKDVKFKSCESGLSITICWTNIWRVRERERAKNMLSFDIHFCVLCENQRARRAFLFFTLFIFYHHRCRHHHPCCYEISRT